MEELDLKELISIFMKRKVLIILVVIIFALLGAIYTLKFITPTYQSTTSLVLVQTGTEKSNLQDVDTSSITTSDVTLNSKLVDNYKSIATSKTTASQVIKNLNLDMSIEALQKITSVTTKTDTEILIITVEYTEPEMACKITRELANVFVDKVNEIYKLDNLNILDEAEVDYTPSNIHLAKNIIIFAFVGGILVSGYILLINMLDTTVKTDIDIEKALNVPVLASIVLTNESARKNIQVHSDNLYKASEFDSGEAKSETSEELKINNNNSLFENYITDEDSNKQTNNKNNQEYHSHSNNNNDNYKSKNKSKNQYRNRRNAK